VLETALWVYSEDKTTLAIIDLSTRKYTPVFSKKINAMISIHQNETIYFNVEEKD